MTVDISKIRVGDEVTVRVKVKELREDRVFVHSSNGAGGWYHVPEIMTHTSAPREIKVWDFVVAKNVVNSKRYKVIHIIGPKAWLRFADEDVEWIGQLKDFQHADA